MKRVIRVGLIIIGAAVLAGIGLTTMYVSGNSMQPFTGNGDYLLVNRMAYWKNSPDRGEVVVYKKPTNNRQAYIGRVVGLPGEKISIEYGAAIINGEKIDEPNVLSGEWSNILTEEKPVMLGTDEYFILADNRPRGIDSRNFGPILLKDIVARVERVLWKGNGRGEL